MSQRTVLRPAPVVVNGDMSGNIISDVTVMQSLSKVSYAYSWTGSTPVGAVSAQVSNDYALRANGSVENAGTWNTIPIVLENGSVATSASVSGNTGNGFIDIQTGAYAVRTIYVADSGTGTMQVTVAGKIS